MKRKSEEENFWNRHVTAIRNPAIHPRYRASYSELYGEEEAEQGSLGIRTFICMILFAVFVFMQNEGKDILHISSTKVVQEVSKNADITDVWKKIP